MSRRVVITGVGAVTGLGTGIEALWSGLCEGRSALGPLTRFDPSGFRSRLGAEVPNFSARDHVPKHYRKAVKVMARDIELAVGAARYAVEDAGLVTRGTLDGGEDADLSRCTYPSARMGCHIGAGLIAADADELAMAFATSRDASHPERLDLEEWGRRGMESLTPLWLLKYLPNMLACHVTIIHGCTGPSNTITCAESSGLLSAGESVRVIERGQADLCFTGSAESKVCLMGLLRMDYAGRLADTRELPPHLPPASLVRPFDPASPGGLIGEGGGILVVEALETAEARRARIYAEIIGFGGGHSPMPAALGLTSPAPATPIDTPDEGFQVAVENALEDSGVGPDGFDAIILLGSGVPSADLGEAYALRAVFGPRLERLPIVTIGPNVGNCAAGIGGILLAVAARCVREQVIPARLNAGTPIHGLDAGPAPARPARIRHALVATSSYAGQNAAVVLRAMA
jgi:3-oxoacyl-[acyl-carrier-protein] synthase II